MGSHFLMVLLSPKGLWAPPEAPLTHQVQTRTYLTPDMLFLLFPGNTNGLTIHSIAPETQMPKPSQTKTNKETQMPP